MTARDWRAVLVLPTVVIAFGFIGAGMIVPAFVAGVVVGFCLVAS